MASLGILGSAGGREYVLKIVADVTDAVKGIDQVSGQTQSFKDKAVGIGKGVAAGLAVAAVAEFGRQVVDAGVAADQAMDAVTNVFGEAGDEVIGFSKTVADSMGLSSTEYLAMAAKSGQAMTQMGISQQDAAKSTEVMGQRAADLAAIFGGDASEAMNAFDKAMIGQTKGLKKYNIVLDKSEIEARALAKGYVDVNGEVTDAGKAIATQELILEKTAKQAGAYANNSGDLAAQQERLAAKFENVKATVAESLMPVLEKLIAIFEPFINFIADNAGTLTVIATAIGTVVVAVKAWEIAQIALNFVLTANPIGIIVVAIGALVAGVIWAYQNVDWFRDLLDTVFAWIRDNWPLLLAILTGPFGTAVLLIIKNWETIKNFFIGIFDWFKNNWPLLLAILTGPFGLAVLAIVKNWDSIRDFFTSLPGKIVGWLSNVGNIIADPFKKGAQWAKDAFNTVTDFFYRLPGQINNWLSNIGNIIKYPFVTAFDAIKSAWNNTIGRISFTVPSWVPGIGGKGWSAPRLAQGGIVNRPTLALIGEAGPEAVVPLNRLTTTNGVGATYVINLYALNPTAETGRLIVQSIAEFERVSGRRVSTG